MGSNAKGIVKADDFAKQETCIFRSQRSTHERSADIYFMRTEAAEAKRLA